MPSYEITVFGTEVTLNGRPVPVPDGANPHTVAVQAAKEQAKVDVPNGEMVHVQARTDRGVFPMAIIDGFAMSLDDALSPRGDAAEGPAPEVRDFDAPADQGSCASKETVNTPRSQEPADRPDSLQDAWAANDGDGLAEADAPRQQTEALQAPIEPQTPVGTSVASGSADAGAQPRQNEAPQAPDGAPAPPAGDVADGSETWQLGVPAPQPFVNGPIEPAGAHPVGAVDGERRASSPEGGREASAPQRHDSWAIPDVRSALGAGSVSGPRPGAPLRLGHEPGQVPPAQPHTMPATAPNPFTHTFIETHRVEVPVQPKPVSGFAGVLAQFGIGGPSEAQQAEEADKLAVSKVWTRPKGIAVANGKGGSGKTPTSLYLAAMFARFGGGMVLVDDNNTFRGAAGWQTENAAHGATKEDLLAALPTFDGTERAADMARFTHHQTTDRYDVLQSRPQKLAKDQALGDAEFDAIQELLRRFYRMVVFDSGNDESAPNWLRMIHHSDVLVVPTATTPKHCESAKLLLEALTVSGGHGAELARNAVIVVSHASTNDPAPEQVAPRFASMARQVVTIPHDPAIAREWLRWDDLAPKTQRAWLAVGAAIARGLAD